MDSPNAVVRFQNGLTCPLLESLCCLYMSQNPQTIFYGRVQRNMILRPPTTHAFRKRQKTRAIRKVEKMAQNQNSVNSLFSAPPPFSQLSESANLHSSIPPARQPPLTARPSSEHQ